MLWVKSFHIFFVMSWVAALFYLPRILVNLASVPHAGPEHARLLLMGQKLKRFAVLLGVPAISLGAWLWLGYGVGKGAGWMHAKLLLVALLLGYEHTCGRLLAQFERGQNTRGHRWYRVFNEASVFVVLGIVLLVVVKPF